MYCFALENSSILIPKLYLVLIHLPSSDLCLSIFFTTLRWITNIFAFHNHHTYTQYTAFAGSNSLPLSLLSRRKKNLQQNPRCHLVFFCHSLSFSLSYLIFQLPLHPIRLIAFPLIRLRTHSRCIYIYMCRAPCYRQPRSCKGVVDSHNYIESTSVLLVALLSLVGLRMGKRNMQGEGERMSKLG